jgi:hypothetical protein
VKEPKQERRLTPLDRVVQHERQPAHDVVEALELPAAEGVDGTRSRAASASDARVDSTACLSTKIAKRGSRACGDLVNPRTLGPPLNRRTAMTSRPTFLILCGSLLLAASAYAESLTLKCTTVDGKPAADLTIDLEAKRMTWSLTEYSITGLTDRYITGVSREFDRIGGEIFVVDRSTGAYQRARVSMTCVDDKCTEHRLSSDTYRGRCARPIR